MRESLLHYREKQKHWLQEFVVMPGHFHLLITPQESLERAMQLIKGGFFSGETKLGFMHEIWQPRLVLDEATQRLKPADSLSA